MKKILSLAVIICIFFGAVHQGFAAQSTADVSASDNLKKKAREDILAARKTDEAGVEEYIIGQGDELSVSVYGEGDMAAFSSDGQAIPRVHVRVDGRVSLKHVGDVHAAGLTLTELADYLKVLYATIYDDPIITTVLLEGKSKQYTLMGKVITPGIFPLKNQVSLVQAIASSGGFNEWASHDVTVVREKIREADKRIFSGNTLKFDYDEFLRGKNLKRNINIQPGDIVIVH
jgi:polysaccharide biosynthesis/export protein